MLYWFCILAISIITMAYVFYNVGVQHLGATAACIFSNVIPVFSLIAAILIGQEHLSWSKPIGIVIVVSGVVLAQLNGIKKTQRDHK